MGDDDEDSNNVDPGRGSDDDDSSDGGLGSARDEEILRKLGLSYALAVDEDGLDASQDVDDFHPEALRSFRVLWELLARWATPSTVDLVLGYRGKCEIPSRVDPGSTMPRGKNRSQHPPRGTTSTSAHRVGQA